MYFVFVTFYFVFVWGCGFFFTKKINYKQNIYARMINIMFGSS